MWGHMWLARPSRSHIWLFIWLGGVQISWGSVTGPLKNRPTSKGEGGFAQRGFQKKGLRFWKGIDQARRLTEAKSGSPRPHVGL